SMDRKTHWRDAFVATCLLALASTAAWAGNGKITGTVTDNASGTPLVSASIALDGTRLGTVTDDEGQFFILNVPPGTYTLRATYIGYAAYVIEEVRVSADLTTDLKVRPSTEAITTEEVVIRAERPIIDPNATNAVRIIGAEDLEILPFRGVQNVLALQAGVVEDEGALHIRGSRSDEIAYYVEGASVRNVVTGNTAVNLIDEALAEIQLQAGGFSAEYGGATAGIVLQELKTGSNDLHISLLSETDNFASDGEKFLDTYSYGYSNQVLTIQGPVLGNDKIRAFVASQRRVFDSRRVVWDGFNFENGVDGIDLTDTGDRGGRVHWKTDEDGNKIPDTRDNLTLTPGNIAHSGRDAYDFNGTLVFDYQPVKLQITGLWSDESREYNGAPIRNMLNTARLPEGEHGTSLINLKATHLLDPSMFYEVNISRYTQTREIFDPVFKGNWWVYNDSFSVASANADWVPYSNTGTNQAPLDFSGFPFNRPGTPTSLGGSDRGSVYQNEKDVYWGLGSNLTKQTANHEIKLGFDYQKWTSRRYQAVLNSVRSAISGTYPSLDAVYDRYYAGEIAQGDILDEMIRVSQGNAAGQGNEAEFQSLLRNTMRHDHFGYDVYGNESDASGLEAPREPVLGAAFIQDKIEYNDLIVNIGLRIDYYDVDSWRFKDPSSPERDATGYTLVLDSMEKTETFTEISPRLGFSFPVSDRSVFHVQYGRFNQMPAMRNMFTGGAQLAQELGGQNYIRYPTAFDIEPMRTTQYEIGFDRQFNDVASFDITGFYRDVKGQIQVARQDIASTAENAEAFNYLQNGDFATTKGLEFVFKVRRTNRLRTELHYTLSDARGTGSTTGSGISGVENDTDLPTVISPLDFNETHRGSMYFDYRFGKNDGGAILSQLGINTLFTFTSGHNFTFSTGSLGQGGAEDGGILNSVDARNRKPLESINHSTTPWTFQVDLKIDKGFDLMGMDAKVYSYVENLFNRRNEANVYQRTGNSTDDGFLTNSDLSSEIISATGGLSYTRLYQAINIANRQHYWFNEGGDLLRAPRQIRFGIELGI
ncbi:MAG: TonB-dependent receptor, partial [Candidatus Latescibacterota bacterium]